MSIKTYSELMSFYTFEERFKYLQLHSKIGIDTFAYKRYLNQLFYKDPEWRKTRDNIIIRDNGCDLGVEGYDIPSGVRIYIHHINPITLDDIVNRSYKLFDPENLITTIKRTHDAIHYGDDSLLEGMELITRTKNDTCPWRR